MTRRIPALVLSLLVATPLTLAQTCDPADFGPITDDPLEITGTWAIDSFCTLDFGDREVILSGTLNVDEVTILAGDLTIAAGGRINGGASLTSVLLTASPLHTGSATISGIIDHDDPDFAGDVEILADGDVSLEGTGVIRVRGTTADGNGGSIDIVAGGSVTLDGALTSLNANGGGDSYGGDVYVNAGGFVHVLENINVSGGSFDAGLVDIVAGSEVVVAGNIDFSAGCFDGFCGYGGDLDIAAGTFIEVTGQLDGRGPAGTLADGGGDGGYATLVAGTDISIANNIDLSAGYFAYGGVYAANCPGSYTQTSGTTRVDGRQVDSDGGSIGIAATTVSLAGTHDAGGGNDAFAGDIGVVATDDVVITGDILCNANIPSLGSIAIVSSAGAITCSSDLQAEGSGPDGEGGSILLSAPQGIDFQGARLDAPGNGSGGRGGSVTVSSAGDVIASPSSRIRANGDGGGSAGFGGEVVIAGCDVTLILDSGTANGIYARGDGVAPEDIGTIDITASGEMTVTGDVIATDNGVVTLTHPAAIPPDLGSANIDPAPVVVPAATPGCNPPFLRGDANGDGSFNGLTDGLFMLNFQFVIGSPEPPCLAAADANGDNGFNGLIDGLYALNFQFVPMSPPIPAPFPDCGIEAATTEALGCVTPSCTP